MSFGEQVLQKSHVTFFFLIWVVKTKRILHLSFSYIQFIHALDQESKQQGKQIVNASYAKTVYFILPRHPKMLECFARSILVSYEKKPLSLFGV